MYKCNSYVKRKIIESVCTDHRQNFNLSAGTYKLNPLMRYMVNKSLSDPDNLTSSVGKVDAGSPIPNPSQVSVVRSKVYFPNLLVLFSSVLSLTPSEKGASLHRNCLGNKLLLCTVGFTVR